MDIIYFKAISQDTDGMMLFGTNHGFLQYDSAKNELVQSYPFFNKNTRVDFINLIADPVNGKDILWYIIYRLYKYDKRDGTSTQVTAHDPTSPSDVIGTDLSSIYFDKSGLMWVPGNWCVNIFFI